MRKIEANTPYERAKKRLEKIKGVYRHATIYIIINTFISIFRIYSRMSNGEAFLDALSKLDVYITWLAWGIGLGLHAFGVFILPKIAGHDWQERKIEQFMKEEESNRSKF